MASASQAIARHEKVGERPACQGLGLGPCFHRPVPPACYQVFAAMSAMKAEAQSGDSRLRLKVCGVEVCNRGYMRLLGIGKTRFRTIHSAVVRGAECCPYDGRYIAKGPRTPSASWMACHDFLMKLWMECAESIPDGLNSNKRPRQGTRKLDDPAMCRSQIKHLPAGSIREYWSQCCAVNTDKCISRKLFSCVLGPCFRPCSSLIVFAGFIFYYKYLWR